MKLFVIITIFICFFDPRESARILGVFPGPTYSHFILGHTLMKELASRGHEVTVISPFPPKVPINNYKNVDLSETLKKYEEKRTNVFDITEISPAIAALVTNYWLTNATTEIFQVYTIQEFLKSDQQFDLVIVEEFIMYTLLGFCYRYNAPCITFSSTGLSWTTHNQVANPYSPAYIPNFFFPYLSNMNFFQRLSNTLLYIWCELLTHLYALPKHNQALQEYFPGAPHITDLYYNISLTLLNSHISTYPPVPLVPNMIEVGGLHIKPPKKLPQDLQEYLDNAKEGVVFFSMGSNLRSVDMPPEKREIILRTFGKLKEKVLWKWEDENLPGKPHNVKIAKWIPQTDVLAHSNVKLFITHGGLLSTTEAIYHGVPIVGIPLYGDQQMNLANAENNGIGLGTLYGQLTEEKLATAVQQVLTDPKFTVNAKKRSAVMRDQPMKPLDRAVFWVEYVIRHKGAPHLRTAALNLAWYQYLLLDVVTFVVVVSVLIFLTLRCFVRMLICRKKKSDNVSIAKKRN